MKRHKDGYELLEDLHRSVKICLGDLLRAFVDHAMSCGYGVDSIVKCVRFEAGQLRKQVGNYPPSR